MRLMNPELVKFQKRVVDIRYNIKNVRAFGKAG